MSKRNGSSVDIDLVGRKAEEFHIGESDDGEGLVDLVRIDGVCGDTGVLESLGDGKGGGGCEFAWGLSGFSPSEDLGNGLDVKFL